VTIFNARSSDNADAALSGRAKRVIDIDTENFRAMLKDLAQKVQSES
jgi:hypothetical protein